MGGQIYQQVIWYQLIPCMSMIYYHSAIIFDWYSVMASCSHGLWPCKLQLFAISFIFNNIHIAYSQLMLKLIILVISFSPFYLLSRLLSLTYRSYRRYSVYYHIWFKLIIVHLLRHPRLLQISLWMLYRLPLRNQ